MKKLLLYCFLVLGLFVTGFKAFAQPSFSYAGSPYTLPVGSSATITPAGGASVTGGYAPAVNFAAVPNVSDVVYSSAAGAFFAVDYDDGYLYKITTAGMATRISTALSNPNSIAVDGLGNLWVADQNNNAVYRMSATGAILTTVNGNASPTGVAVDASNNVYFTDQGNNRVYKIAAGTYTRTSLLTGFNTPSGIAVSGNNIFVAQQGTNSIIEIVNGITGSTAKTTFATGLNTPENIRFNTSGYLYEADAGTNTVKAISTAGAVSSILTGLNGPSGITFDGSNNLYEADYFSGQVKKSTFTYWNISASLPTGLSFNYSTGVISGTPSVTSPATNYTITGYNSTGSLAVTISIACVSPTTLTYNTPNVFTVGTGVTLTPAYSNGLPTSCSIVSSPAGTTLASVGLSISATGVISGTPTAALAPTNFIVTSTNAGGNAISNTFSITIVAAAKPFLTYNPSSYTIIYGTAITASISNSGGAVTSTYAVTSGTLPSGLSLNATTGAITGTPVVTAATTVTVNASNAAGSSVIPATITFTVTPAPLTVTGTGPTKTYGTALTAGASTTNFTYSGTVGTQTVTSVTLTPDALGASATTPAGSPYTVTPSAATGANGFTASNYAITYIPYNGTVGKANLNITANGASKVYGNTLTGGPGSTAFTSSGLQNSETVGSVTIAYGAAGAATANVGNYTGQVTPSAATGGTFNANNYNITYTNGTITVTGATLTVTATGPTKVYGTALTTGASTTNFTATAAIPGQAVTSVTLTPNAAGASATTAAGAAYTVTPSAATGSGGFLASNYIITYVPYNGTVAQAPLTVTATGPTKTYGTALTTATSTTNFTYSGTAPGQAVTSVTLTPNAAGASATTPAGSAYTVTPSAATGSGGFTAGNYSITYVPYNGTVAQAILNIQADNQVKIFGAANPPLTVTYTGFVNGDTQASFTTQPTVSTTATTTSPVGTYPITATGAVSSNYIINYTDGILTINVDPPMITYVNPAPYMVGTTISPLSPNNSGGPVGTSGTYVGSVILKAANGLNNPYGMAVDATGNVYVTNYSANTVTEYSTTGTVSSFTTGSKPVGIVFDAAGNAFVLQQGTSSIVEYAGGLSGPTTTIVTGLNTPTGIAIDASGFLYVANTTGNGGRGTITKYANTGGAAVLTINPPNSFFGSGYVANVNAGIAVDAAGNIYVVDNNLADLNTFYFGSAVDIYSASGAYTGNYENGNSYAAIAIDKNGNIYLTDNGARTAAVYTANFATTIVTETGFNSPRGIVADASGDFYVSDYNNNTVTKYAPVKGYVLTGTLPAGLGFNTTTGTITGTPQVAFPATIYTVTAYNISGSSSTMVTLSCVVNPPVIAYNPTTVSYPVNIAIAPLTPTVTGGALYPSQYITTPVTFEAASSPWGMAYAGGKIYVTNSGNNSVSVYNPTGGAALLTFSVAFKPTGIAVDGTGNMYVIFSNGDVYKYNAGGTGATLVTNAIYNATGNGIYNNGIAIDGSGNLFMTDFQNGYIWEYNASSAATSVVNRGFNGPTGIQVDASGNIYIVELNGRTLKKVSVTGGTSTLLSGFNSPYSLYVDAAGNYYIGGSIAAGAVSEYSSSGTLIQNVTSTLGSPRGIVVDGSGNLFVADFTNNKVVEYTPTFFTISPATPPPGLVFDPNTGKFTGTPTAVFGPVTYTVTAYGFGHVPVTTTVTISCVLSYDWVGTQPGGFWNVAANWLSGSVPISTSDVNIGVNRTFTYPPVVSASTSVKSATLGNKGGQAAGITVNTGFTLAVTGDITKQSDANSNLGYISALSGSGAITAANINVIANKTAAATYTESLTSSINSLRLSGNIALRDTTYNSSFIVNGGTTTLTGTVLTTNISGSTSSLTVNGGTLQFANATVFTTLSTSGTNVLSFTGTGTVEYSGAAQTVYTDAAIPGLTAGPNYQSIKFSGTGAKTLNGGNLNVAGDFTNALTNDASNYVTLTSTPVNFNGTTQSLAGGAGKGTVFNTVSFSGTGTKTMASGLFSVISTGTLNMLGTNTGTVLNAGGFLTLNSDVNGAATVSAINGPSITGNVNVQRYITGGSSTYRGYRMLSSPVSTSSSSGILNINYLINQVYLTGTSGTGGGFDGGSNPSLYLFRENLLPNNSTFTGGNFRGFNNITAAPTYTIDVDGTGFQIPTGNGYQMFYRGDRKAAVYSAETTPSYVPTADTLTATGYLNQGAITVKNWYDNSQSLLYSTTSQSTNIEGYNLLGNPYASSINFDTYSTTSAGAGIYAPGTNPFVYILDPVSKNYNVYQAGNGGMGTIAATGSNIIASGEGFFIVANTAGATLTFNEAAKISSQATTAGGNLFLALQQNQTPAEKSYLRLELNKDTINRDAIFINFNTGANAKYAGNEDAPYKVGHGYVSLASRSADGISLAINTTPYPKQNQPIPLNVSAYISGSYTLKMTDRHNMPDMYDIWLKDAYLKDSLDIKHNSTYTFDVNTSDTGSYGNNRFSLIIRQDPALALHLLNFTASKAAGTVQTAWTVENEADYTKFSLLKSTDGVTFSGIDSLLSSGIGTYSFADVKPQVQNYYKLQLTDLAGNITYSAIVPVLYSNTSKPVNGFTVYPNPTNSMINIAVNQGTIATSGLQNQTVTTAAPASGQTYDIKITNMTGEVLKTVTAVSATWQNNVSSLLPGTYIIQVFSHGSSSVVGRTTFVKL